MGEPTPEIGHRFDTHSSRRSFLKVAGFASFALAACRWFDASPSVTKENPRPVIPERREVTVGDTRIVSFCQERFLLEQASADSQRPKNAYEVIVLDELEDAFQAMAYLKQKGVSETALDEAASHAGAFLFDTDEGNAVRENLGMPLFDEQHAMPFYLPLVVEKEQSGQLNRSVIILPPLSLLAQNLSTAEQFVFPAVALNAAQQYVDQIKQSGKLAVEEWTWEIGYYLTHTFPTEASRDRKEAVLRQIEKILEMADDPNKEAVLAQYRKYADSNDSSFPGMQESRDPLIDALMNAVENNPIGSTKDELVQTLARMFYFTQYDTDKFGTRSDFGIRSLLNVAYADQSFVSYVPDFFYAMISREASQLIGLARDLKQDTQAHLNLTRTIMESTLQQAREYLTQDYKGINRALWPYVRDPYNALPLQRPDSGLLLHIDPMSQGPKWFRERRFLGVPIESLLRSRALEVNDFGYLNWQLTKILEKTISTFPGSDLVKALADSKAWGGIGLIGRFLYRLIQDESNIDPLAAIPVDMGKYRERLPITVEARTYSVSQLFPQTVQNESLRSLPLINADRINGSPDNRTGVTEISFLDVDENVIQVGDVCVKILELFAVYIKEIYKLDADNLQPIVNEDLEQLGPMPTLHIGAQDPQGDLFRWVEDLKRYQTARDKILERLVELRRRQKTVPKAVGQTVRGIKKALKQRDRMQTLLPAAPSGKNRSVDEGQV